MKKPIKEIFVEILMALCLIIIGMPVMVIGILGGPFIRAAVVMMVIGFGLVAIGFVALLLCVIRTVKGALTQPGDDEQ